MRLNSQIEALKTESAKVEKDLAKSMPKDMSKLNAKTIKSVRFSSFPSRFLDENRALTQQIESGRAELASIDAQLAALQDKLGLPRAPIISDLRKQLSDLPAQLAPAPAAGNAGSAGNAAPGPSAGASNFPAAASWPRPLQFYSPNF